MRAVRVLLGCLVALAAVACSTIHTSMTQTCDTTDTKFIGITVSSQSQCEGSGSSEGGTTPLPPLPEPRQ